MLVFLRTRWTIVFVLILFIQSVAAQGPDSLRQDIKESTGTSDFVEKMKKIGEEETVRSIEAYNYGKLSRHQRATINKLVEAIRDAKSYLEQGVVDTSEVEYNLLSSRKVLDITKEGIFINKGSIQTQRNLTVSNTILTELLGSTLKDKSRIDNHANRLYLFKETIDSLYSDSTLYSFPSDSISVIKYLSRLRLVAREILPVDSAVSRTLASVQDIQPKVDLLVHELQAAIKEIGASQKLVSSLSAKREIPNIWEARNFSRPFREITVFSFHKIWLGFRYYVDDHFGRLFFLLMLVIGGALYLKNLQRNAVEHSKSGEEMALPMAVRRPLLTATFLVLSIFQFIFNNPPLSFNAMLWGGQIICLSLLFRNQISAYWMKFWFVFQILFVLAVLDGMILQASRPERWFMAILSAVGAGYSLYILFRGRHSELRERGILYFVGFVAIFQIGALLFNITGRYNMSKTMMVSGFIGIVIAICFLWTIRLVNQILSLSSTFYKEPHRNSFYINFEKVGDHVPRYFYVLLVIGWLVLVGRNFYFLKEFGDSVNQFISQETSIGSYSFSIKNLFIFFLVMGCSLIASRLVSYFATDPDAQQSTEKKSKRLEIGSWILLIRIFIISMGLFLAFAATGIPLDKITIILGALGVGIGLGLQGLVNNLVSGLIIAFEKPVNVGDTIEVNGKQGTMKSIGFRSSVLKMPDGSHFIVPNGDLLSGQLVNWTTGKNMRRVSIVFRVAYGSDVEKVKSILTEIVSNDERILQYPPPGATATGIANNAIDFELLFWIANLRDYGEVRGDVILKMVTTFREAGITIPTNQQDIYIKGLVNDPSKSLKQETRKEI